MTFKSETLNDFKNVYLNSDEFAEAIVYTPYRQPAKSIKAIVLRERLEPARADGSTTLTRQCKVLVANDSSAGVTTVKRGQDVLSFPTFVGEPSVNWTVIDIISKDDSCFELLVGK